MVKRNLEVDWTEPHREGVRAGVRAAVRRVLWAKRVEPEAFEFITAKVMEQAEAMYGD